MKILFCGDIVGSAGRKAITTHIPALRKELQLDAVVVNAENAAAGFGLTKKIVKELTDAGVDAITTGNHVWDQREFYDEIQDCPTVLRPMNYPRSTAGRGCITVTVAGGRRLAILNVMGRLFMDPLDDPFAAIDDALKGMYLKAGVDAILIDVHAEASSEKQALGYHVDGRVSAVVGTHTHVPTADGRVLPHGTGYQTDAGMCGDYDSVIGMRKEISLDKFRKKFARQRNEAASVNSTLCAVLFTIDDSTGLCQAVQPIRRGDTLTAT